MKLVQINCWDGRITPKIWQFIEREKPDFITAQEIYDSTHDLPLVRWMFNLTEQIREISGLEYKFFAPRSSLMVGGEERFYGTVIFSRWDFSRTEILQLTPPKFDMRFGDPEKNVGLNLQIAEIEISRENAREERGKDSWLNAWTGSGFAKNETGFAKKFELDSSSANLGDENFGSRENLENRAGRRREEDLAAAQNGKPAKLILANYHGFVTYGEAGDGRNGDADTEKYMRKVAAKLREFADLPLILAGDFNVASGCKTMQVFDGWLRDLTAENGVMQTLSPLHRYDKPVACDHVLVNYLVEVREFAVRDKELLSDHLPMVVGFEI